MVNGQLERGAPPTAGEVILYCKSVVACLRDWADGAGWGAPGAGIERRRLRKVADLAVVQVSLTAVPLALTMSMERPSLPRCS